MFKKNEVLAFLVAPVTGKIIEIEDVPDEMFSQKLLGEGIAIEPTEGVAVSPLDGEVVQISPTKHAVGIRGNDGLEVLIHIGIETVSLNGMGFQGHVQQGDKVKAGDKLVTFDLEYIRENADSIITPLIITNSNIIETMTKTSEPTVTRGESVFLTVKVK